MVQSLPCFLNLCLNVCSPSQVLRDVYTEVLEAAYPLHRDKRSVGQQVSLSEVHNQLFSFAHIQRETVVLAPWCKSLHLIQVCGLINVGNEAQNHSIISKFDNRCGSVRGHAVMCVERVEQGTQDTTLRGSYVQGDGVWGVLAYNEAELFLNSFPDVWLDANLFLSSTGSSFDLRAWFLLWYAFSAVRIVLRRTYLSK